MKYYGKTNKIVAGIVVTVMLVTMFSQIRIFAENMSDKYPYTMFAASDVDGAITINADNFSVNGNIATNGTILSNGNMNVNGTKTEHADENMIYISQKIDDAYFQVSDVDEYPEDYVLEETNINIDMPMSVEGETTLTGNINISSALKSLESIYLYGEVKNTDNSVIFSESGDIIIDSENVNLSGLIYAPYGKVEITAKNLNLNSIIIIARNIVINAPSVNANYGETAAKLVGTTSDEKTPDKDNPNDSSSEEDSSENNDSSEDNSGEENPDEDIDYETDENGNGLPDFFEDFHNWEKAEDTDGDGLPDGVEDFLGTDKFLQDSDGDELNDFYEIFVTLTDPSLYDSVGNGISDGEQDFDEDGLTNIQEYECGTKPHDEDTDKDGLKDGDEVYIYGTDPLVTDSDEDGLEDGDEIYFGTDPTDPDSNNNGILDGDEKRPQEYVYENEGGVIQNVSVSMEATGNLQKTMEIENILGKDVLCSRAVGLFGEPFSFETESEFDTVTITFEIDQSQLGDTALSDLLFLWYDEENCQFIELETIYDENAGTVSTETTHFSSYLLVDSVEWFEAWAKELDYSPAEEDRDPIFTFIALDLSSPKNMDRGFIPDKDTDPEIIKNSLKADPPYDPMSVSISEAMIHDMRIDDRMSIMFFSTTIGSYSQDKIMKDKKALEEYLQKIDDECFKASYPYVLDDLVVPDTSYIDGYSNFDFPLSSCYSYGMKYQNTQFETRLFIISSGKGRISDIVSFRLDLAKRNNIQINTVAVGENAAIAPLRYIAHYTGGKCYVVSDLEDIYELYEDINIDISDSTDTDGDGIPDIMEITGMRTQDGEIIYTKPYDEDSDDDGLLDGQEIDPTLHFRIRKPNLSTSLDESNILEYYCIMSSDPNKIDSDDDGLLDGGPQKYRNISIAPRDPEPLVETGKNGLWNLHISEIRNDVNTASGYSDDYYEPIEFEGEWKKFLGFIPYYDNNSIEVLMSALSSGGSFLLDFRYDDKHIALHSDTTQWQSVGGYNDFYDWVFDKATSMDKLKLDFALEDGQEYVVWAWKGNYLNLGAGTEVGFYKKSNILDSAGVEHWVVGDTLPMTLSLYRKSGASYISYYHWLPYLEQWWITGFVPNIYYWGIKEDQLVHISSVDFSSNTDMLDALKEENKNSKEAEFLIFDIDDHRLWIMW